MGAVCQPWEVTHPTCGNAVVCSILEFFCAVLCAQVNRCCIVFPSLSHSLSAVFARSPALFGNVVLTSTCSATPHTGSRRWCSSGCPSPTTRPSTGRHPQWVTRPSRQVGGTCSAAWVYHWYGKGGCLFHSTGQIGEALLLLWLLIRPVMFLSHHFPMSSNLSMLRPHLCSAALQGLHVDEQQPHHRVLLVARGAAL